jgi:phosphatidylglycerophosphatase C
MGERKVSGTAIFDLDRTLTLRGCFTPFALYAAKKHPRRFISLPSILLAASANSLGFYQRDDLKLLIWRKVIGGLDRAQIEALGTEFGENWARKELRPETKAVLKRHQEAGDRLVLATAAMDVVAEPFGRLLGFNEIISTRTSWTADGYVSGAFEGKNCSGEEKLRRVRNALRDIDPRRATAYSDHISDLPLLLWVANGVAVNPHKPLRDAAGRHGLRIEDWG